MSEQSADQLTRQHKELTELNRVVTNGLNWLGDIEMKVAHIQPISEFIAFLTGFKANVNQQLAALSSVMPKPDAAPVVETKPVEVQVVA
jgi:hypothetical protein